MIWNIINLGQTQCEINSCRSGSQTLFFGGREATTGNASAVRRLVGLTHSDKLYVFQTALVRADQSKTTLWESRDMKMIKVFNIPTFEYQQKKHRLDKWPFCIVRRLSGTLWNNTDVYRLFYTSDLANKFIMPWKGRYSLIWHNLNRVSFFTASLKRMWRLAMSGLHVWYRQLFTKQFKFMIVV